MIFAYSSLVIYSRNEGNFPRCPQKTEKQIIIHRHWCDCRSESTGLTGATRSLSMITKGKGRIPSNSARVERGPTNRRDTLNARIQKPPGSPPIYEDWTPMYGDWSPGIQGLDPRGTETGPPRDEATRPGIPQTRTKDFMGFKISRDAEFRGIQDFTGCGTSWDSGLRGIDSILRGT